jgi:hypothetical protein
MNDQLAHRLDQIQPKITSESFLSSAGLGNEIACYIFDYPAEDELLVRDHLQHLEGQLQSRKPSLRWQHLNLLDVCVRYLQERGLFDKALEMQVEKGDESLKKALKGPMAAEKIRDFLAKEHALADSELLLVSGVGSVWPMLRAHSLLNCLHPVIGDTPLVMFYPGTFDGTALRLFGQAASAEPGVGARNYYRAFHLIGAAS